MSLKLFHFTAIFEQLSMWSLSSRELEHPNSHTCLNPKLFGISLISVPNENIYTYSSVPSGWR